MKEDLLEISDGKLYSSNDMVKVGCHDCAGCSSCCRDMGQSIWLDPYDVFRLTHGLQKSLEELLADVVELHVEDGLILPNLRMIGDGELVCGFLNQDGRCSIHDFRPGFCRLFPLGRNYEEEKLSYFLLKDACPALNKSKIKIHKWLNTPNLKEYETFLVKWHALTKKLRAFYADAKQQEEIIKALNMKFLHIFYMTPYDEEDFYPSFYERLEQMNAFLHQLGL